jgi:uncharacterized membrane protein
VLWLATPAPAEDFDPNVVTPGVIGFILTIVVVFAVVLLMVDMSRRMRRVRHRAEINERLDAEEAAAARGEEPPAP